MNAFVLQIIFLRKLPCRNSPNTSCFFTTKGNIGISPNLSLPVPEVLGVGGRDSPKYSKLGPKVCVGH